MNSPCQNDDHRSNTHIDTRSKFEAHQKQTHTAHTRCKTFDPTNSVFQLCVNFHVEFSVFFLLLLDSPRRCYHYAMLCQHLLSVFHLKTMLFLLQICVETMATDKNSRHPYSIGDEWDERTKNVQNHLLKNNKKRKTSAKYIDERWQREEHRLISSSITSTPKMRKTQKCFFPVYIVK